LATYFVREQNVDNLKSAVLHHPHGDKATFNPRYLDFAAHYGFEPRACNVRKANEKGRVENGVGYIKKNFLAGLELPGSLGALNAGARQWMDSVANVRIHGETRKQPAELFALEKRQLRALTPLAPDTGIARTVRVTNRCRVVFDTNRYSVPSLYASQQLTLKIFAERLCVYHEDKLVAKHTRCYDRHQDFEDPDHVKELLERRRKGRDAKVLMSFHALSPHAEQYALALQERRFNPRQHIAKILALAEAYGREKVARALADAFEFQAFSSDYIANLLEQRERFAPQPSPLHLTRRADLLDLELPRADLSIYDPPSANTANTANTVNHPPQHPL